MAIFLTQICRLSNNLYSWMVEYEDGYRGRNGREVSYAAADRAVRAIVDGDRK